MPLQTEILTTKFHRPRLSGTFVPRHRLLRYLEEQRDRPLILVSAPAGYGKTTLISSWLEGCEWPSAWLSLDEGDDGLGIFMSHMLAAIDLLFPSAVDRTLALLATASRPSPSALSHSLGNELDQIDHPFILTLDDYHHIQDTAVHDLLDELLAHPPRSMHLVLISRADPPLSLSRLRARSQVAEIRIRDLRFTREETAAFVEQEMRVPADERVIRALQRRVEGWVAGMRLVLLSLRHWGSVDLSPARLQGHVLYVTDYLATEVFKSQPQHIQDYLLSTAILDRFTAPLCEAICVRREEPDTQRSGEKPCALSGQAFVAWLRENNLFITPLDDRGEWYRYHPLFRELLQGRLEQELGAECIAALHSRASAWFVQNHLIDEAIRHALAAGETETAIQVVGQNRRALIDREKWRQLGRWLRLFPRPVIDGSPELLMSEAWVLALRGRWEEIGAILSRVQEQLALEGPTSAAAGRLAGEVYLFQCNLVSWTADGNRMLPLAQRALELIPPEWEYARGLAVMFKSGAQHVLGKKKDAYEPLFRALEDRRHSPSYRSRLLTGLCILHWADADLPALERAAKGLIAAGREHDLRQSLALGHYFLGCAHYQRGQLPQAQERLLAAYQARLSIPLDFLLQSAQALALTYQALGHSGQARETLAEAYEFFRALQHYRLMLAAEAARAELALRQGLLAEANRWAQSYDPYPLQSMHTFGLPQLTLVKLLLAQDLASSRQRADQLLAQVWHFVQRIHNVRFGIEVLALQAWLCDEQGDESAALEQLERAVHLAEPGGSLRLFIDLGPRVTGLLARLGQRGVAVDYITSILAARESRTGAAGPHLPPAPAGTDEVIEPLTNRELEILTLLAQRLTNKEIAARLFISPGTVSQHTHRLYRKLGVHSRRQAVTRAQELGLVPHGAPEDDAAGKSPLHRKI